MALGCDYLAVRLLSLALSLSLSPTVVAIAEYVGQLQRDTMRRTRQGFPHSSAAAAHDDGLVTK